MLNDRVVFKCSSLFISVMIKINYVLQFRKGDIQLLSLQASCL